jgi:hypothetical protein
MTDKKVAANARNRKMKPQLKELKKLNELKKSKELKGFLLQLLIFFDFSTSLLSLARLEKSAHLSIMY